MREELPAEALEKEKNALLEDFRTRNSVLRTGDVVASARLERLKGPSPAPSYRVV